MELKEIKYNRYEVFDDAIHFYLGEEEVETIDIDALLENEPYLVRVDSEED